MALSPVFPFFIFFQRIATILLWVLLLATVNAQNRTGEVQTLLQFKTVMYVDTTSTSNLYWSTWNQADSHPCNWWGVTCTAYFTVEQLDFSSWGLMRLPSFAVLSNLADLRALDLGSNNFIDANGNPGVSIPGDVGSLTGLTRLVLRNNSFGGPFPRNITACRNLRYLSLELNALTGEVPDLSSLVSLQYLYLKGNRLSGSFPTWLGQTNTLLAVDLTANMLNGIVPSFPNLTNIREVILDNNRFTSFQEPIFPGATNLEHLSVGYNLLTGPIPASLTELPSLRVLRLSGNQLTGAIPSNFSLNMGQGIALYFDSNQLTGTIPPNLLQSTPEAISSPILNLGNNLLTGPIPFSRTKQYNYNTLNLNNNNLSGGIPSICRTGSTYINHFDLDNNNLSGDILEFFVDCYDRISHMHIANNFFTGDLSSIAYASATVNSTRNQTLRSSTLRSGLRDLSNNNLQMTSTEANPDPLRAFLEFFVLNTPLTQFTMNGNNFSGTPLPSYFSSPASLLHSLDLSNNNLTGEISAAAFNPTWLPTLQQLDLSNNDITGPIPEALVTIPTLAVLNLMNNSLSGPLPAMPNGLNPNSFSGNPELCGGPFRACSQGTSLKWWVLLIIIGGSVAVAAGSCLAVRWRWRVHHNTQQQHSDLIQTLLERESASVMSLRELKKATSNFAESSQIGEGAFGIVYTGKLIDGTTVAIKRSKCGGSERDKDKFLNEVRIVSQINHRHLVKFLGCCMESGVALLVSEFVANGTLLEHLQGKLGPKRLSWDQRLNIAVQTSDALNYLHSAASFPIYHRDVKSANILLDCDFNVKVADFGISKLVPLESTHVSTQAIHGTMGYIDPEYYTSYQLNDRSDVYSFGVVLLELICAKPAIDFLRGGDNTGLVSFAMAHMDSGDLHPFIDVALVETYNDLTGRGRKSILDVGKLAMKCLQTRSQDRPSMHNVWKELRTLWFELQGTFKSLQSMNDDNGDQRSFHDHIIVQSGGVSGDRSSFNLDKDDVSRQMADDF
ncbi:unnamed protein product [Calypogeia fissa]